MILSGKVWKFGDNISTDLIAPGRYFHLRTNLSEFAKHVLEDARNDFAGKISKGDLIVAGSNFGLGSSREHAPRIIKIAGVACIIAKSFARIFYRNAINIGLPVIILDDVDRINENNELKINLSEGIIENISKKETYTFNKIPDFILNILESGGIENIIKDNEKNFFMEE